MSHARQRYMTVESVISTDLIGYPEQTALERQDMHCAYLAHHEPESVKTIDIIMYMIVLYSTCTYYTASKQGSNQTKEGDGKGTNRKGPLAQAAEGKQVVGSE